MRERSDTPATSSSESSCDSGGSSTDTSGVERTAAPGQRKRAPATWPSRYSCRFCATCSTTTDGSLSRSASHAGVTKTTGAGAAACAPDCAASGENAAAATTSAPMRARREAGMTGVTGMRCSRREWALRLAASIARGYLSGQGLSPKSAGGPPRRDSRAAPAALAFARMTAPTLLRPRTAAELVDAAFVLLREHYADVVAAAAVFLIPAL